MPNNLGLATSIANLGSGIAPVFWALESSQLLNPSGQQPDIKVKEGARYLHYFDENIAINTPDLFLYNSILWFVFALLVFIFQKNPEGMSNGIVTIIMRKYCNKKSRLVKKNSYQTVSYIKSDQKEMMLSVDENLIENFGNILQYNKSVRTMLETEMYENLRETYKTVKKATKSFYEDIGNFEGENNDQGQGCGEKYLRFTKKMVFPKSVLYKSQTENFELLDIPCNNKMIKSVKYINEDNDSLNQENTENLLKSGNLLPNVLHWNEPSEQQLSSKASLEFSPMPLLEATKLSRNDEKSENNNQLSSDLSDNQQNKTRPIKPVIKIIPNSGNSFGKSPQKKTNPKKNSTSVDNIAEFEGDLDSPYRNPKFVKILEAEELDTPRSHNRPNNQNGQQVKKNTFLEEPLVAKDNIVCSVDFITKEKQQSIDEEAQQLAQELAVTKLNEEKSKIVKSFRFWAMWFSLAYSLSLGLLLIPNVKSFGLMYFTEAEVNFVCYIGVFGAIAGRLSTGIAIDKFGICNVLIFEQILMFTGVLLFYFFESTLEIFYLAYFIFYICQGICVVSISTILSFLYGINIAMKLQPIMQITWSMASVLMLFQNTVVLGYLGFEYLVFICGCVNGVVGLFYWIIKN